MTARIEDGGPAEAGLVAFLNEAARYFEKRPTNGEDRAHWANVFNAENCRKAAAEITRLRAENAGMLEALAKTETRFLHCADMIEASFSCSGTLRAERTIKAKHYALEVRAAISRARQMDLTVGRANNG
jgi:hypothetical protein